jgi:class 3 adenylate cyclase/tetratricopeptide (TPR) repeat protein
MADVFISYARSTVSHARAIARELRAAGYSVWLDEDLPTHRAYSRVIEEQLDAARAALVIWSADAAASDWVRSEANRAREAHKLVQVLVDQTPVPMPFDQTQYAILAGWSGASDDPAWRKTLATIAELMSAAPEVRTDAAKRSTMRDGERRHVAALFCDIADAAELAARLDPEDWHEITSAFQRAAADVLDRFGGHVGKHLGHGVAAYFGYPRAQEDAAERAVLAGLEIREAIAALGQHLASLAGVRVRVRGGVHCGTVVITHLGEGEPEITGEAPNIALRVQELADPDCLVISEAVRTLAPARFETIDLGTVALQGGPSSMRLYRVVRPVSRRRRGHPRRGHTPFVGRSEELRLLLGRWERSKAGDGQAVLLVGEPGIGKTHLVDAFRSHSGAASVLEAAGAPFYSNTPFHAIQQLLHQVVRGGSPEARRRRLDEALARSGVAHREAGPLIAELLGLPGSEPPLLAPEQRRVRLMAVLADWLLEAARVQPLLVVIEDLQWVDPSTMEVIQALVDQGAAAPLMLLLTARPQFKTPWSHRSHHANIALGRLDASESRTLVASVAADRLAPSVVQAVLDRTDGVPLFIEELTRLMVERAGRPGSDEIPATLRDSLAARLDRLGPAREVAQLAAVIGREFSYEVLEAIWPGSEPELVSDLGALADAELIHARGSPPQATYRFRHALVQTAAYEALLKRRRRELHVKVAEAIEGRFGALAASQPEVLARHWSEAGQAEKAMSSWRAAGDAASTRRAFREAEAAYNHALAELASLAPSGQRDRQELELTSLLGRVLQVTQGYAAPEALEMAARARSLAENTGSLERLIREEALFWNAVVTTGDYAGAVALAGRIEQLSGGDASAPPRQLFALNAQVQTRFYTGDLAGAEEHHERLTTLAAEFDHAPSNFVVPLGIGGLNAWMLGRREAARERMTGTANLAEGVGNPYVHAVSLHFRGVLQACDDDPTGEPMARRMLGLCEENGFAYLADLARGHLGWAIGRNGSADEGAEMMRSAWTSISAMRANVGMTLGLTLLADIEARAGSPGRALATVEEALACNPQERVFRPETLRLRGELRLAGGDAELAEADFGEALTLARRIGARAWELRTAASLGRLLADQGRSQAARELLEPLAETPADAGECLDMIAIRGLLDRLGP